METSSGLPAAIYVRISDDAHGDALGVQRQEADARKLCAARGWSVAEVFCDNDRSAFDPRKVRTEYQEMLTAISEGKVKVVVAWHPDRLHRQTRELVGFIDLVNAHGVQVETVTAGVYDLATPTGRMNARIIGSVAEFESEHKSERIRRKLEANAADGKHHGGSRPYGWLADRVSLDDAEAAVVRDAAAQLLAGETVMAISRTLNAGGHKTATGRLWTAQTVRDILLRPRNAGLRVHHGEVVGQGVWQPILTREIFHQVQAILSNPARRTTPGRDGRVHLLSVIARCGVCDGPMIVGKSKPYKGRSVSVYRCREQHVSRNLEPVDDLVTRMILARLALPDARTLLAAPGRADQAATAATTVQDLQDRLKDAAEAYASGVLTMAQLTAINAAIRPKLAEAASQASAPDRVRALGELVDGARTPAEVWADLSPARRRAVVDLSVRVRIMPTARGRGFNPEAIVIEWKS